MSDYLPAGCTQADLDVPDGLCIKCGASQDVDDMHGEDGAWICDGCWEPEEEESDEKTNA